MIGTERFCKVFKKSEQIGRLYVLPHYHARGNTFRIYVLPEGEKVIENCGINPPLNNDAIEVYGVVGGNPGWTERYGWIHDGKWKIDFFYIVEQREEKQNRLKSNEDRYLQDKEKEESARVAALLYAYE